MEQPLGPLQWANIVLLTLYAEPCLTLSSAHFICVLCPEHVLHGVRDVIKAHPWQLQCDSYNKCRQRHMLENSCLPNLLISPSCFGSKDGADPQYVFDSSDIDLRMKKGEELVAAFDRLVASYHHQLALEGVDAAPPVL